MNKIRLTIFAALLVVSCKNKTTNTGYHLPVKTMEAVLMDVTLAEAYSTVVKDSVHKQGAKNFDSLTVYYSTIFNHYKITSEEFKQSLDWYKANPEKLDTMYTSLLGKVTLLQKNLSPVAPPRVLPVPLPPPPAPGHIPRHN